LGREKDSRIYGARKTKINRNNYNQKNCCNMKAKTSEKNKRFLHALVYVVINLMIVIINIQNPKTGVAILNMKNFSRHSLGNRTLSHFCFCLWTRYILEKIGKKAKKLVKYGTGKE
jgi:hypothetical protein